MYTTISTKGAEAIIHFAPPITPAAPIMAFTATILHLSGTKSPAAAVEIFIEGQHVRSAVPALIGSITAGIPATRLIKAAPRPSTITEPTSTFIISIVGKTGPIGQTLP